MGAAAGPNIVEDGLVLHLDAANERSYPGSGATWFDLSGYEKHASFANDTSSVITDKGRAISFDGSGDYVTFGSIYDDNSNEPFGRNNTEFTLLIFAKVRQFISGDTNHGIANVIAAHSSDDDNDNFELGYTASGNIEFYIDDNSNDSNDSNDNESNLGIPTNEWHMNGIVYNANKNDDVVIYLDDQSQSFSRGFTGLDGANGSPFTIGASLNVNQYFDGFISLISLYNRALTESEIKQNFQALRGRYGI
jgi:hypothetical protein